MKEAIKTGDLQKVAEIASSLSSILNFMSRQDKARRSKNETEAVAITKGKRKEVRTAFIVYSLHTRIFIIAAKKKKKPGLAVIAILWKQLGCDYRDRKATAVSLIDSPCRDQLGMNSASFFTFKKD